MRGRITDLRGTISFPDVCAENNLDPGNYEKLLKDGVSITR
jgi:hypothetical protein